MAALKGRPAFLTAALKGLPYVFNGSPKEPPYVFSGSPKEPPYVLTAGRKGRRAYNHRRASRKFRSARWGGTSVTISEY